MVFYVDHVGAQVLEEGQDPVDPPAGVSARLDTGGRLAAARMRMKQPVYIRICIADPSFCQAAEAFDL
jgi:hypothetical protein